MSDNRPSSCARKPYAEWPNGDAPPIFCLPGSSDDDQCAYQTPIRGVPGSMIGFIVAGLIIGALARLLMPGKQKIGLLWTLLVGLAGSVIGGTIANAIGTGDIFELNVLGFCVAVLSSVALLGVAERSGLGAPPERKRLGH
jgi:uncharacterized membrane protein YeaQ/YmgE (transglycosylase-associated protein family)